MAQTGSLVTVGTSALRCLNCGGRQFTDRQIKLNTTGAEFFGVEWANRAATGLICCECGYLHEFVSDQIGLWTTEGGYPTGTTNAE
jgi:predicted nucleic-acid-binding Zn-ribbon protein